uniref:NADH-ubiquinone oxidoreductase chain 6 n=1 Tax=Reclinomonas americana TaxID=48483 RepID=O21269_RECAM|nr:NADH dehydrogenase subunit 6 [Reclinomonas americana]AAD11896.1 NADH dehydrogenase subunit 6 [Reclinomonas americana]
MTVEILFYFFSFLALSSATLVIASSNPIHSVLFLVLVFCSTSGLFILIEAEFIAMIFIMVYVGAIAVLFLFVVMMLNVRLVQFNVNMLRYLPLGGVIGLIFLLELFLIIDSDLIPLFGLNINNNIAPFQWADTIDSITNVEAIGKLLYTHYFYLFLVSGMILLVAMIGAIVLTMYKRVGVRRQDINEQLSRDFKETIRLTSPIKK